VACAPGRAVFPAASRLVAVAAVSTAALFAPGQALAVECPYVYLGQNMYDLADDGLSADLHAPLGTGTRTDPFRGPLPLTVTMSDEAFVMGGAFAGGGGNVDNPQFKFTGAGINWGDTQEAVSDVIGECEIHDLFNTPPDPPTRHSWLMPFTKTHAYTRPPDPALADASDATGYYYQVTYTVCTGTDPPSCDPLTTLDPLQNSHDFSDFQHNWVWFPKDAAGGRDPPRCPAATAKLLTARADDPGCPIDERLTLDAVDVLPRNATIWTTKNFRDERIALEFGWDLETNCNGALALASEFSPYGATKGLLGANFLAPSQWHARAPMSAQLPPYGVIYSMTFTPSFACRNDPRGGAFDRISTTFFIERNHAWLDSLGYGSLAKLAREEADRRDRSVQVICGLAGLVTRKKNVSPLGALLEVPCKAHELQIALIRHRAELLQSIADGTAAGRKPIVEPISARHWSPGGDPSRAAQVPASTIRFGGAAAVSAAADSRAGVNASFARWLAARRATDRALRRMANAWRAVLVAANADAARQVKRRLPAAQRSRRAAAKLLAGELARTRAAERALRSSAAGRLRLRTADVEATQRRIAEVGFSRADRRALSVVGIAGRELDEFRAALLAAAPASVSGSVSRLLGDADRSTRPLAKLLRRKGR
jgi:hypothetical protein